MPDEPMDPIEALKAIRVYVEAAIESPEGASLAGTLGRILAIVDRALLTEPPSSRRAETSSETE